MGLDKHKKVVVGSYFDCKSYLIDVNSNCFTFARSKK